MKGYFNFNFIFIFLNNKIKTTKKYIKKLKQQKNEIYDRNKWRWWEKRENSRQIGKQIRIMKWNGGKKKRHAVDLFQVLYVLAQPYYLFAYSFGLILHLPFFQSFKTPFVIFFTNAMTKCLLWFQNCTGNYHKACCCDFFRFLHAFFNMRDLICWR